MRCGMLNHGHDAGSNSNPALRNDRPIRTEAHAKVLIQQPAQNLRPFVKSLVIVEFPADRKLRLLPDTSFVAEFRFKGEHALDGGTHLPRAAMSGLWDTARPRTYAKGTGILLVKF